MSEELLRYYNEQLTLLRKQGKAFAKAYPKIASHMNLEVNNLSDPLVAHLLEAFAFLSGRIQHNIDKGHESLTCDILSLLCPHYDLPLPAFGIIQIQPSKANKPFVINRHETLRISKNKTSCYFRTGYHTEILPLTISDIEWKCDYALGLEMQNKPVKSCFSITLSAINTIHIQTQKIRFYINMETMDAHRFYEYLNTALAQITLDFHETSQPHLELPVENLNFVGFEEDETLLPYPDNSFKVYGLLSELFTYPEKFLFFDIKFKSLPIPEGTNKFTINLFLNTIDETLAKNIHDNSLLINCTPIINLFEQQGEPIRLKSNEISYPLIADNNVPLSDIEVYTVTSMKVVPMNGNDNRIEASPYFNKNYATKNNDTHLYWHIERKPCWKIGEYHLSGTEAYVTFSALQNNAELQLNAIITPFLVCTNREATTHIDAQEYHTNLSFYPNNQELVAAIEVIRKLTKPQYRKNSVDQKMAILNHLSIHQLGFSKSKDPLRTLKNLISIYELENKSVTSLIEHGLMDFNLRTISKRVQSHMKQSVCHGIEAILTIDENYFSEHNTLLFSSILQRWMEHMSSINNFVQLILKSKQRGIIKVWQPHLGGKHTL